jgi:hypothetical protein
MVIVPGELPVGELVPVRIDGAMVYDLMGVPDHMPSRALIAADTILGP